MATTTYLDVHGLGTLWSRIKTVFMAKATSGTVNQVLTLTDAENQTYAWADVPSSEPEAISDEDINKLS